MDSLKFGLKTLCKRNRDGSFATQADRRDSLVRISCELVELGFRRMQPTSLKTKHVKALVAHWQAKGLTSGTIKNKLAHIRWWAEKVGCGHAVPNDNLSLGVEKRVYVTNVNKAQTINERHDQIKDAYVHLSLELQQAFGLRREESIKFSPSYADRGDRIALKASWTKGGKAREIPIETAAQREVLDRVHQLVGKGALIPPQLNYIQQRHRYDGEVKRVGLNNQHGLRHGYAQRIYQELTGRLAPAAGGPKRKDMSAQERQLDNEVRLIISRLLGHERLEVVAVYLGR